MISKIQTNNSNYPNFKGTYIVQIPHKAFANPENIKECSKLVGDQMSKLMRPNKFLQKCNKLLNMFNSQVFCYPERFSYMFSKTGMDVNNMNNSIKWLRENTGLPVADVLRKNFHSFFIYTNKDADNVLKDSCEVLFVCYAIDIFLRQVNDGRDSLLIELFVLF